MLAQGLAYFKNAPLSVLGMLLFLIAFVALTVWTYSGARSKDYYQKLAELPLAEGED